MKKITILILALLPMLAWAQEWVVVDVEALSDAKSTETEGLVSHATYDSPAFQALMAQLQAHGKAQVSDAMSDDAKKTLKNIDESIADLKKMEGILPPTEIEKIRKNLTDQRKKVETQNKTGKSNPIVEPARLKEQIRAYCLGKRFYTKVYPMDGGLAKVFTDERKGRDFYSCTYGFIDTQGQIVIPQQYYIEADKFNADGWIVAAKEMGGKQQKGILNRKGEAIIPFIYEDLQLFDDFPALPAKKAGKWGAISCTGEQTVPFAFDRAFRMSSTSPTGKVRHALMVLKGTNAFGIVDLTGHEVVPCRYSRIFINEQGKVVCLRGIGNNEVCDIYEPDGWAKESEGQPYKQ